MSPVQDVCPSEFVRWQRSCYHLSSDPLRWTDAFAVCHSKDSRLAWVETEEEMCWLVSLMHEAGPNGVFVGGKKVGDQFKWLDFNQEDSGYIMRF